MREAARSPCAVPDGLELAAVLAGRGRRLLMSALLSNGMSFMVCTCVRRPVGGTYRRDSSLKMKTRIKRPAGAKESWGEIKKYDKVYREQ